MENKNFNSFCNLFLRSDRDHKKEKKSGIESKSVSKSNFPPFIDNVRFYFYLPVALKLAFYPNLCFTRFLHSFIGLHITQAPAGISKPSKSGIRRTSRGVAVSGQ